MKRLLIPILFACLATGCSWMEDNSGIINMTANEEEVPEDVACIKNYFPIKFNDFDADEPFDGYTRIRMFESISRTTETHFLSFEFVAEDPETLEKCPSPKASQTYDLTRSGCVRASLQLNGFESPTMLDKWADSKDSTPSDEKICEDAFTTRITGTLEIGELSFKKDKRVTGKYSGTLVYYHQLKTAENTIIEREVPIGKVEGTFSFVNRAGAAWDN